MSEIITKVSIAKKMIAKGYPLDEILEITELTTSEIAKYWEENTDITEKDRKILLEKIKEQNKRK